MIQRTSKALIPTVKESPAEATNVSHVLLLRAGYVRQLGAGIYTYLPLAQRVLQNIAGIVRDEMNRAGALEVLLPALLPAEYFRETGRWDLYGDVLFRLKDRKGGDYHLGPTHEEIITDMARREVRSYRQLPLNLYQIQTKFRDEPRPRGGVLRGREFIMKDAYSFDCDEAGARESYEKMRQAYVNIFTRLGLTFRMVQADSGAIGGKTSAEFQVLADSGEDAIVACDACDYAANVEAAEVRLDSERMSETETDIAKVHTPGLGGIVDVAKFLHRSEDAFIKSILFTTPDGKTIMACVRGDHEVNPVKLAKAAGVTEVHMASEGDIERATAAKVGFAGPVYFKGKVFCDLALKGRNNMVTGANETDYHLTGVSIGRDFAAPFVDLRLAKEGDPCPACDKGKFKAYKGIEGGHIFILGTHYSAKMKAVYLDEKGQENPMVMGCYGIGISRLLASAVEQHHDADGIRWPVSIAPYKVHLCTLGNDEAMIHAGQKLASELDALGLDVLWDERDERPGVKFKDADLIGLPVRITLGAKTLAAGSCEIKLRTQGGKEFTVVGLPDAAKTVHAMLFPAQSGA